MRRTLLSLSFLALIAAILALGACSARRHPRVLFVGVDGASWDVMAPLLERGELPNLQALAERGVASPLLTIQPSLSPIVWTTIATGKSMDKHGITGFLDPRDPNRPVRSNDRKVRAIWDLLGESGIRVGIVGWWLTWPAEPVNGFMVSSYSALAAGLWQGTELWKGSAYQGLPGQVHPPSLGPDLDALIERSQDPSRAAAAVRDLFGDLDPSFGNPTQRRVILDTKAAILSDSIFFEAARSFGGRESPDFLAVYFGAVDVSSHRFWKYHRPEDFPGRASEREIAALGSVIPNAYRWVDARLGELVAEVGPETIVIVASDHGFHAETQPYRSDDERSGGHETADLAGILVAAGPVIRRADWRRLPPAKLPSVYDLTPTLLHLYGLPVASDMDGSPILALFDEGPGRRPPERIRTYEIALRSTATPPPPSDAARILEEGIRARLRSLGYLGGESPAAERADPAKTNREGVGSPRDER